MQADVGGWVPASLVDKRVESVAKCVPRRLSFPLSCFPLPSAFRRDPLHCKPKHDHKRCCVRTQVGQQVQRDAVRSRRRRRHRVATQDANLPACGRPPGPALARFRAKEHLIPHALPCAANSACSGTSSSLVADLTAGRGQRPAAPVRQRRLLHLDTGRPLERRTAVGRPIPTVHAAPPTAHVRRCR